jgi:hypothetical protein
VARHLAPIVFGASLATALGCRDTSRFSNRGDHYEGEVVKGSFVRSGIAEDARMCVTLDADHLQDSPGTLTTSDGRFRNTPLRPIPQIWHDPLSTMSFGDGRKQNLVYVATPNTPGADSGEVMVFLSLMDEGGLELRVLRGAPQADAGAVPADAAAPGAAPVAAQSTPLFGIFTLDRREGTCTF